MSKHENALRAALLRLNGQNPLPVSAFTPAQRRALERFGQQTGAVQFLARGSGGSYRISNPAVFALHLRTLSPLAPIPPVPASPEAAPAPHPRSWVPSPAKGAPPVADSTGTPCAPPDTDTPLTTGTSAAAGAPPIRAHNIGHRRDSKAGRHAHDAGYVLLKAAFPRRNSVMPPSSGQPESGSDSPWGASHIAMTVPDSVPAGQGTSSAPLDWHAPTRNLHPPLAAHTRDFGAACLRITPDDDWHTDAPLWLIENQALFDRTDWLPPGPAVTLLYYNGQLSDLLVRWLAARPRGSRLIHFPDYDGIGLANFARLHAQLGDACHFWLMPGWADSLQRYGSHALWLRTLDPFLRVRPDLPSHLAPLLTQMELNGLALEQEAVWLTA